MPHVLDSAPSFFLLDLQRTLTFHHLLGFEGGSRESGGTIFLSNEAQLGNRAYASALGMRMGITDIFAMMAPYSPLANGLNVYTESWL